MITVIGSNRYEMSICLKCDKLTYILVGGVLVQHNGKHIFRWNEPEKIPHRCVIVVEIINLPKRTIY